MINRIINKQGSTLLNLQGITVNEYNMTSACTAHNASGYKIRGTNIANCYFFKDDARPQIPSDVALTSSVNFVLDSKITNIENALYFSKTYADLNIIGNNVERLYFSFPAISGAGFVYPASVTLNLPRCKFLYVASPSCSFPTKKINLNNMDNLECLFLSLSSSASISCNNNGDIFGSRIRDIVFRNLTSTGIDAPNCENCLIDGLYNAKNINLPNLKSGFISFSGSFNSISLPFSNLGYFSYNGFAYSPKFPETLDLNKASYIQISNAYSGSPKTIFALGARSITSSAFYYCSNLETLVFGGSSISSNGTFTGTKLKRLYLPRYDKIVTLQSYASKIFPTDCSIYVPNNLLTTYKNNTYWNYISNRIYSYNFGFNSSNMLFPMQYFSSTANTFRTSAKFIPYNGLSFYKSNQTLYLDEAEVISDGAFPYQYYSGCKVYAYSCKWVGKNEVPIQYFYLPECETFNNGDFTFISYFYAPKLKYLVRTCSGEIMVGYSQNFSAVKNNILKMNATINQTGNMDYPLGFPTYYVSGETLKEITAPLCNDGDIVNLYIQAYKNSGNYYSSTVTFPNVKQFYGFKGALTNKTTGMLSNKTFILPNCKNFLYFTSTLNYSTPNYTFASVYPVIKLDRELDTFWIAPTFFSNSTGIDYMSHLNAKCSIYISNNSTFDIKLAGHPVIYSSTLTTLAIPRLSLYVDPSVVTKYREQTYGLCSFITVNPTVSNPGYKNIMFKHPNNISPTFSFYTSANTVRDLIKENSKMRYNGKFLLYEFSHQKFTTFSPPTIMTVPSTVRDCIVTNNEISLDTPLKDGDVFDMTNYAMEVVSDEGEYYIHLNGPEAKSLYILPPDSNKTYEIYFEKIGNSSLNLNELGYQATYYENRVPHLYKSNVALNTATQYPGSFGYVITISIKDITAPVPEPVDLILHFNEVS